MAYLSHTGEAFLIQITARSVVFQGINGSRSSLDVLFKTLNWCNSKNSILHDWQTPSGPKWRATVGCLWGLDEPATNNLSAEFGQVMLVPRSLRDHLSAQWLAPVSKRTQLHIADGGNDLGQSQVQFWSGLKQNTSKDPHTQSLWPRIASTQPTQPFLWLMRLHWIGHMSGLFAREPENRVLTSPRVQSACGLCETFHGHDKAVKSRSPWSTSRPRSGF